MLPLRFPSTGLQVLSALIHFLGVAILSHCLSRRLATIDSTWRGLLKLSWPRLCVIIVFLDSWLYLFSSGVLIFGVGLELTGAMCSTANYFCIAFYTTSKIFTYFFLIERVHVVWSRKVGAKRFQSKMYILCFSTVCLYTVVITLMCFGRINFFRGDGTCVIGLKSFSSIPLLSYDLYVNVFLTGLFLWPLLRANIINVRVKRLANRTLLAAAVALTTSTVNLVVLAVLGGTELGWICLGGCGVDLVVNACALFYATAGAHSRVIGTNSSAIVDFSERESDRRPIQLSGKQGEFDCEVTSTRILSPRSPTSTSKVSFVDHPHLGRLPEYFPPSPIAKGPFNPSPINDGHQSAPDLSSEIEKWTDNSRTSTSALQSATDLFRKEQSREDFGVQITVTTDYENHDQADRTGGEVASSMTRNSQ